MVTSEAFYAQLPEFEDFVEVTSVSHYRSAPSDWLVIITDVIGSTKAIEAGRYKDVNALGVASIVALRNALPRVDIPYVFGGDGATILVPGSGREAVEAALRGIRELARTSFDMGMRASLVPIAELHEAGFEVLVGRFRASTDVCFAMFSGGGLSEAERRVKDPEQGPRYAVDEHGPTVSDFTGFECRWQPIPSRHGQVASILVQARADDGDPNTAGTIYREVLAKIQDILEGDGRPVDSPRLNLQPPSSSSGFDQEAKIRSGHPRGLGFAWRRLVAKTSARVGRLLLDRGWRAPGFPGDEYRGQVVANTDFRKFDDTLRMVVDVGPAELEALYALLAKEHERGVLAYGVHVADASLMTCAIQAYDGDHVHFVDGADGGYALAAKQLKAQLAGKDA